MSNEIAISSKKLTVWETIPLEEIKANCAPLLSNSEFKYFVEMGKACDLNPFLREIWSVKYDQKVPAQVFIARDGYRKAAQRHPDYDFHYVDAVYTNDQFKVVNGEVQHEYTLKDRGKLVGAYCFTKRKNSSRPMYVYVELSEYNTNKSNWLKMPATMIKKVAESQCLRATFQELFSGSNDESEQETIEMIREKKDAKLELSNVIEKNKKGSNNAHTENMAVEVDKVPSNNLSTGEALAATVEASENQEYDNVERSRIPENVDYLEAHQDSISDETLQMIHDIIYERKIPESRVQNGLKSFGVLTLEELTEEKGIKMINIFKKPKD